MAKYLIERAAQPQILDKIGKTALDYCSFKEATYFKGIIFYSLFLSLIYDLRRHCSKK